MFVVLQQISRDAFSQGQLLWEYEVVMTEDVENAAGEQYMTIQRKVSNGLWTYCGYTCSSLTQSRIVAEDDEGEEDEDTRWYYELPFVRKSPWPKSPTSNLTVLVALLTASFGLSKTEMVFYSSLLSPSKGTPSKFHWLRHLNSSSHLPSQVTQQETSSLETRTSMSSFAREMGILRFISSCCTERRECSERLATRIWFIRNCTRGRVMTPDSVFAIASNSKLFLAMSVSFLISNKTLAEECWEEIKWSTKIRDLIPEWGLMDEEMDWGVSLQDMLTHRTSMPRHDLSGVQRRVVFLKRWVKMLLF